MTKLIGITIALLALAGCQQTATVVEAPPTGPQPRIFEIKGQPVVCFADPAHIGAMPEWPAICSALGPFIPCTETEKTLDCSQKRAS